VAGGRALAQVPLGLFELETGLKFSSPPTLLQPVFASICRHVTCMQRLTPVYSLPTCVLSNDGGVIEEVSHSISASDNLIISIVEFNFTVAPCPHVPVYRGACRCS
jgi:hypothetical protein